MSQISLSLAEIKPAFILPPPLPKPLTRRRRLSRNTWASVAAEISREHHFLLELEPNSPRIRSTTAPVGWLECQPGVTATERGGRHEQRINPNEEKMSDVTEKLISAVVENFGRVEIVNGLKCSKCGAQLSAHSLRFDGVEVALRCDRCHTDALTCAPRLPQITWTRRTQRDHPHLGIQARRRRAQCRSGN